MRCPLLGITLADPGHQNLVNKVRDILVIFFPNPNICNWVKILTVRVCVAESPAPSWSVARTWVRIVKTENLGGKLLTVNWKEAPACPRKLAVEVT